MLLQNICSPAGSVTFKPIRCLIEKFRQRRTMLARSTWTRLFFFSFSFLDKAAILSSSFFFLSIQYKGFFFCVEKMEKQSCLSCCQMNPTCVPWEETYSMPSRLPILFFVSKQVAHHPYNVGFSTNLH